MRAGAHVLLMATDPVKHEILRQVAERPLETGFGGEYRITPVGHESLFAAFIARRWLQAAPRGSLVLDDAAAAGAITPLAEGWSSTVMHSLAREPLTLGELDRGVDDLSRRELKSLLAAMLAAGQLETRSDSRGEAVYAVTDWLRAGMAPLIASARIERRHPMEEAAPIDALDVEAGFMLTLPLLELPRELSGSCRLGLNLDEDEGASLTGVTARVEQGRVVSCVAGLDGRAGAWAAASASDWLDTVIEHDAQRVRTGGDRWLAGALLDGLHRTLFGIVVA
jgi:DNA-binding HxlR family transcriptional regulator